MSTCVVGVPRELKKQEGRVGMTPKGVSSAVKAGAMVLIERGAGVLSGFPDAEYATAGAVVTSAEEVWGKSDIVVKVKEPIRDEYPRLLAMKGKTLFTYLHLAGTEVELTRALLRNDVTAIAYETVELPAPGGRKVFPLLVPMSKIAGTQAMRGALARHKPEAFSSLNAVIIGGGNVGEAALHRAIAENVGFIVVFEACDKRLRELRRKYSSDHVAIFPMSLLDDVLGRNYLKVADIIICCPMLPGGKEAPIVLTQKHFRVMKHDCYISDVSIDQGGSTAWTKGNPTKPGETFTRGAKNLVFSAVPNIPGSTVPAEATRALTEATQPYVIAMVEEHLRSQGGDYNVLNNNRDLRKGLQTFHGLLTNEHVAAHHGLMHEYKPLSKIFPY